MPYNSLSKNNLKPGRKAGARGALAQLDLTQFGKLIQKDKSKFYEMMYELSAKDYCDVYLRILKLVKDAEPDYTPETQLPNFTLELVSATTGKPFDIN